MPAPRLDGLKPAIGKLSPLVSAAPIGELERSRYRDRTQHWRAWYKTPRWLRIRRRQLSDDLFTCRICGTMHYDTAQLVCDHVQPHHGDEQLFWSGPFQTLCRPCHDGVKQSAEKGRLGHVR